MDEKRAQTAEMQHGPLFDDPYEWFGEWFEYAMDNAAEAHACVVSTVSEEGQPSSRVVYLKEWDARGFVWYTNLTSQKGREALATRRGAMNFFWRELREQIRIEGVIEQVSDEQANVYFASRARGSQLGAWASDQSSALESREALLSNLEEVSARFEGEDVPRPPHWSGLRLIPLHIEFWRAGEHRLHDRFLFSRPSPDTSSWKVERLNP